MNEYIGPLLKTPASFTLLLAPPGWGKTRMLLSLYKVSVAKMIFVSPLRALANEFFESSRNLGNIFFIEKKINRNEAYNNFFLKKQALLIATAEMFDENFIFMLEKSKQRPLVILDEFHLFYYWGLDFRPFLWELCMGLTNSGVPILGLSATVGPKILNDWRIDFLLGCETLFLINFGNQKLKNIPDNYSYFPDFLPNSKKIFNKYFLYLLEKNQNKVFLYFCKYRQEVDLWVNLCHKKNINAIGCKGGEVQNFILDLENNPTPRCIFSTSALSHGVNLPAISMIFLSYRIENIDFWIQMSGRGGRRGEKFELYTFNKNNDYCPSKLKLLLNFLKIYFLYFYIKFTKY